MNKRHFIAALAATLVLATGCTTTGPNAGDPAARRQNINSGVDNALARLYQQAAGSEQLVRSAKGVLVRAAGRRPVHGGFPAVHDR